MKINRVSNKKYTKVFGIFFLLAAGIFLLSLYGQPTGAAGTISGRVFQDYNGNGLYETAGNTAAVDRGLSAITVTAFDSAGVSQGLTTTAADGTYSLSATGTGPYRVEFTNLPAGYFTSTRSTDSINGGTSTNSGSSVQFVNDGATTDVNLAINRPIDFCQNNPTLVTTCYAAPGSNSGGTPTSSSDPVLISFPYGSGTTSTTSSTGVDLPNTHSLLVPQNNVGTIMGLAYHRRSQKVFAGAFTKRHSRFRNDNKNTVSNDPTGEIFISNSTGTTGSLFLNLNTLFGSNIAGANPHDVASYFNDTTAFDAVGKTGFGDIDISEDEQTLYAVNLNNRSLYTIPLGSGTPTAPTVSSQVAVYDLVTLAGASATCPNSADLRPGALKIYNGTLYYGLTCTAQTSGTAADLRAFVYSLNLTGSGTATQVADFALNYPRGFATRNATDCTAQPNTICAPAAWRPWISNSTSLLTGPFSQKFYPQPWLLDIEFDKNNFMVVGLSDRVGHQTGNSNGGATTGPVEGVSAGDTLRLRPNGAVWTLESNASDGTNTTGGAGNGQGPTNGEFYFQEQYPITGTSHEEITLGNLLVVPGFSHTIASAFDPAPTGTLNGQNTYRAGGLIWLSNTGGTRSRSYQLFGIDAVNTFGKAAGIGDIEAFCNIAPIQLGNRVWNDANANGVQDPGEAAIGAVTVRLYKAGVLLATAVTDAAGEYYFTSGTAVDPDTTDNIGIVNGDILPSMAYEIRFDNPANYTGAGPLNGLLLTGNDETSQLGFDEGSDSDAVLITNPTNSPAGTFPVITVTTGVNGENNYNLDTGFVSSATFSIGNRVWFDTNNDGAINVGEVGISGVSVSLLNSGGTVIGSPITTDANGYYRFDGLAAGDYTVRISASNFANGAILAGYQNTTGANNTDLDSTSVAGQNGENGINPTGAANSVQTNGILSGTITLGAPGEPTNEADVQASGQGSVDPAANMTVDFGFYCLRLSGTLWNDTGAGANNNNGILDAGETTISSVRVRLFDSSGVEVPVGADGILGTSDDGPNGVITNGSGNYSFSCLPPGQYRVVVGGNNGGTSSTPTSTTPDDNIDSDDNGFPGAGQFNGFTISNLVTLTPGNSGSLGNNTVTNSNASTSNPTVDFGFIVAPTYVKLDGFDVWINEYGTVIKWSTAEEFDNLGFNIYREVSGKRELINRSMIAGGSLKTSASLAVTGDYYNWTDNDPKAGAVYYLEDIDMKGNSTIHGPVAPKMKFSPRSLQSDPLLLSDLSRTVDSLAGEKELVGKQTAKLKQRTSLQTANTDRQFEIAEKEGVKISVRRDGWYHISPNELRSAGFNLNSNREFWQMFADGAEVAFKLGTDASIEFYGSGNDKLTTDTRVYYLIEGAERGQRLPEVAGGNPDGQTSSRSFTSTVLREDRQIYLSSVLNGENKNFFGAVVNTGSQTAQTLTVRNLDSQGQIHLRVKLQGLTNGNHLVSLRLNGLDLGTVAVNNLDNRAFEYDLPLNAVTEGINQVFLQSVGTGNDVSLVDSISLSYPRLYAAVDKKLRFTVPAGQSVRVGGFASEKIEVFEIRNGRAERQVRGNITTNENGAEVSMASANYEREFLAIERTEIETAVKIERNHPSNWSDPKNGADFVIITPEVLSAYAEELAQVRISQGLKTQVVFVEDIYDEFGFGEHSPETVREFLRTTSTEWQLKPRYVLLLGKSSWDPRNYLGQMNRDLVPTKLLDTAFQETGSDAWLADFNNDGIEDISLGRLPVSNAAEADVQISKLARYDSQTARQRSSVMVSDRSFEYYNDILQSELPEGVQTSRIERSSLTDAEMHEQILSQLSAGPMIVTYTGHGSPALWGSTDVFKLADVENINNEKLSFYMMMTCLNGYIISPTNESLAEALIKRKGGGAIAVWASSGTTYPDKQLEISRTLTRNIFGAGQGTTRLGDLVRQTKQATTDRDVKQTWHLIGDPTIFIK